MKKKMLISVLVVVITACAVYGGFILYKRGGKIVSQVEVSTTQSSETEKTELKIILPKVDPNDLLKD